MNELDGPSKVLAVVVIVIVAVVVLFRILGLSGTRCADGAVSSSQGRGTCSQHGGIDPR
jgi:hypothetical protein